jgi:hypothetical protein
VGRAALKRAKVHLDNVRATIRGIVLNDVKAEVSSYTPDMQYMQQAYDGDLRRRAAARGKGADAPAVASFGRR